MRPLHFESLESRRQMAVTAGLNAGHDVEIRAADAAANDIAIAGTSNPGEVTITGRNGTLVNGQAAVTLQGVTGSIDLKLRGSVQPQAVAVDNLYVAGFIYLELPGTATIGANGPVSSGQFMWVASTGVVQMTNTHINGSLVILPFSGGAASVSLMGVSALWSVQVVSQSALLSRVNANGPIDVTGSNVAVLNSSTGSYLDVLSRSTGETTIYVDACYAARYMTMIGNANQTDLTEGNGPVQLTVHRCQTSQLVIRTGQQSDRIDLYANNLTGLRESFDPIDRPPQTLYVNTRGGDDAVSLRYNVIADLFAGLGNGDDSLSAVGNVVRNVAYLDGDAGDYPAQTLGRNRLGLSGNQFGTLATLNFS